MRPQGGVGCQAQVLQDQREEGSDYDGNCAAGMGKLQQQGCFLGAHREEHLRMGREGGERHGKVTCDQGEYSMALFGKL